MSTYCIKILNVSGEEALHDNEVCTDVVYGPDIAILEIQGPEFLSQGYSRPVTGLIKNLGVTNESVTLQLITNNTIANTTTILLESGESTTIVFMWDGISSGIGTYEVKIHAVPVANETYYINQEKSFVATVLDIYESTFYVDDDAPAEWYDATNHVRSIQEAINKVFLPNQLIFVHNGCYHERLIMNKTVRVLGESIDTQ